MTDTANAEFGRSWWGQEWINSLDRLSTAWQNRLPRGRDYAAKGHVISLSVSTGKITAKVQGSRSKPYATVVEIPTIKEDGWDKLISRLASKSRYPAQLLNGEMPDGIGDIFEEINVNPFPTRSSELLSTCTCPDKAKPCKHIVAVHYAFGEALDQDPFLLFLLRGADRETLLKRFHHCWFGEQAEKAVDDRWTLNGGQPAGVRILPFSADRFNRSPDGEDLEISVYVQRPEQDLLILGRLGNPPSWELPIGLDQLLGPVIEETSRMAFDFATSQGLGEEFDGDGENGEVDERPSPYDSLLDAFSVPDIVKDAAADIGDDQGLVLPQSLPAADMLTGAIGVSVDAAKQNQERELKAKRKKQAEGGAVLIRKGAGGAPGVVRRRRKVVTPVTDTPASRASDATTVEKKAPATKPTPEILSKPAAAKKPVKKSAAPTIRKAAPPVTPPDDGGPVVRRRGRRIVAGADQDQKKEERKKLVQLDADARAAWEAEDATKSFEANLEAWRIEPSEARYMLLAANRDQVDDADEQLKAECKNIVGAAQRRGRRLTTPELLLLLTMGQVESATDFVVEMDDEVWMETDGVGSIYIPFALMALVAEREVPDGAYLSKLWDGLFDRGEEHFQNFDIEPAPIGAWLEWALDDYPISEEHESKLLEVVRSSAMALIEAAREERVPLSTELIASYVVAVAECLRLVAEESVCDQFLAIANARTAAIPPLGRAVQRGLSNSSLIGYRNSSDG